MQVIILCAGTSSRMDPISDKVLLNFMGKSILEHQIEILNSAGLFNLLIVANNFNASAIKQICQKPSLSKNNWQITIQNDLKEGMQGAIKVCKNLVQAEALIINSNDIVEKQVFNDLALIKENKNYQAIICGKIVEKYFPGGYLSIDENNKLLAIVEKPAIGKEPSNLVNLVIHYFQNFNDFANLVENFNNSTDDAYEQSLQSYCQDNIVHVYKYHGFWQAIKYPWHLLKINDYFLSKIESFIHESVIIENNVTIKGNCYIEANVKIYANSVIVGPVYIGKNSIIANNCLIRQSHIGENCVIGFNTEVARSFLHKNIWTHSNYIGDSVIDENVSLGAGTVTGNLRLDEKNISVEVKGKKIDTQTNKLGSIIGANCRIGINCSINPGIKIGNNCFIASGVLLFRNVDKKKFIQLKSELIEKDNTIDYVSVNDRV